MLTDAGFLCSLGTHLNQLLFWGTLGRLGEGEGVQEGAGPEYWPQDPAWQELRC